MDARQGKQLNDTITNNVTNLTNEVNKRSFGYSFSGKSIDWEDGCTPGLYYGCSVTGIPGGGPGWGHLITVGSLSSECHQIWAPNNANKYYSRFYREGSWSGWEVLNASEFNKYVPLTGGTMSGHLGLNTLISSSNSYIIARAADGFHVKYQDDSRYMTCFASGFQVPSSLRVKENIQQIPESDAIKVLDINVVKFDYIQEAGGAKGQYGVIAEDVLNVYPNVVNIPEKYNPDADLDIMCIPSVDYSKFVPFLIKMVQMQQKEIDELKDKLNNLS